MTEIFIEWLKRLERRWYQRDYLDEKLRREWLASGSSLYSEVSSSAAPVLSELKTILLFKPDEIGDAVCALPAIEKLRAAAPTARLLLLCQTSARPIYERTRIFDEIVEIKPRVWFRRFPTFDLDLALAQFSTPSFDAAIFLRTYLSYFRSFRKIKTPYLIHPLDPRMRSTSIHRMPVSLWSPLRKHQSLQMLEIVGYLTGEEYSERDIHFPQFHWTEEDRRATEIVFGDKIPEKFLVVHPFARLETRRYPYFHEILDAVRKEFSVPIVIIGGPGESSSLDGIHAEGKLSLGQTGYLLSRASAFLGNEAGPAHLSAALGRRTITFFGGHSLPVEWGPVGKSLLLRVDVPCAPCHLRECRKFQLKCMTELKPERVLPQVSAYLKTSLVGDTRPAPLSV